MKHSTRFAEVRLLYDTLMVILSLVVAIPFLMVILNSVKSDQESTTISLRLPSTIKWGNFSTVIIEGRLWYGFMNSMIFSCATVILVTLFASMAAFVIQRRNNQATRFTFHLFFSALILPASLIPTIKMLQLLHLYNSYSGVVLLYFAIYLPFSIFLFVGFFKSLPREIDEAAIIDGCSPLRMFVQILLPLTLPVTMTQVILVFMGVWNDFQWPLYLLSNSKMWTLPLSVFSFVSQYSSSWNLVSADLVLAALPVVILFVWLQKFMLSGLTSGALKG